MSVPLDSRVVLLALLATCTWSHAQPATEPAEEVVTGLVVGADGKPLAGATVVLAVPVADEPGNERPPWEVQVEQHQAVSGDDGSFALPGTGRASDALWLLVSTDDGAAQMRIDAADRGKRHVLRVQPYGRVEGVVMRGTKPLPGEMVTCHSTAVDIGGGVLGQPLVQFREQTRADAQGKFVFPRVPPGRHEVGHMVVRRVGRSRMLTLTHATPVMVKSNETTSV